MMRWILRIAGGLAALVVAVFGLQMVASETGEVVVLHATDSDGSVAETRLWVVDHGGRQYLRVGADGSGWYSRIAARPEVRVARGGQAADYLAVAEPESSERINALMAQKYGWRDDVIGALVGGREGSIPIRLDPR
ncbi:MAG: hypothetical protein CMK33_01450 [Porticoccaceae bacterium]|nr:hypothetical protein [Porticoccaceae bacterium]